MTSHDRVERQLPGILEDLAAPRRPDYVDDLRRQLAATGQRPAWTLPERWLPMTEFAGRVTIAPRLPYRSIAVALLLIALLVAAGLAWIGSRPHVPAPFGPARNGAVLSVPLDGHNLYAIDPTTGAKTLLIAGTPPDGRSFGAAVYMPDGTHIVFESHDWESYRLYVTGADGRGATLITRNTLFDPWGWHVAPDGRSVLVISAIDSIHTMSIARIDGSDMQAVDVGGLTVLDASFRPGDPDQILFLGASDEAGHAQGLYLLDAARTVHTLIAPDADAPAYGGAFSPDGTTIAYTGQLPRQDRFRVHLAQVDASGDHVTGDTIIGHDFRARSEAWPVWSPSGDRLLIQRTTEPSGANEAETIPVVVSVDGIHEVAIHDTISGGADTAWSPDGTMIQVRQIDTLGHELQQQIWDPNTGESRPAPWDATSNPSWQRQAF